MTGPSASLLFYLANGDPDNLNWGVFQIIGVPLGGFVAATWNREFQWRAPPTPPPTQHAPGGGAAVGGWAGGGGGGGGRRYWLAPLSRAPGTRPRPPPREFFSFFFFWCPGF